VCRHSPIPWEIGIHHSHYAPDHNNYIKYSLTLTHTWIEGQLFRYYLTGDRRSLMAADLTGRAFARCMLTSGQMFDRGRKGVGMGSRGYGRANWALCELYRATLNPRYLWAMRRLNGYLTASLRPDGAVPAGHSGAGEWNTTDECPHAAAICAAGLARFEELTDDGSVVPHLERIAKWQISRGAMPAKLGIMYHNYQGGEVIHFVDACADMLEAWAFLYDETENPLYRDFAEMVYDTMIEMKERWQNDWTMCVRNVLFYLARRDTWPSPSAPSQPPDATPWDWLKTEVDSGPTVTWIQNCQNDDGGFGVAPGVPSDMDSTFRAADALRALGARPRSPAACADWVLSCRNDDRGYAGEPGWHSNVAWTWFAVATLDLLRGRVPEPEETAAWLNSATNEDGGNGPSPAKGGREYSTCEYTAYKTQALECLGALPAAREKMAAYLQSLQVEGTGFHYRWAGPVTCYTMDALDGLASLGAGPKDADGCARWLRGLRRPDGGYGWPDSDRSTLRHTAHCILSLGHLKRLPRGQEAETTIRYVLSCQIDTGGFGYRPGRSPMVTCTWYAVRVLETLSGPSLQP